MLDFNGEEEQQSRNYGPVPTGSIVFLTMSVEKPTFVAPENPYVAISKGGLRGLWVKFEVVRGTYAGCSWYENVWLPKGMQQIRLHEGQETACNMSGAKLRAIVEAHRGIFPKDQSPQANRQRQTSDWLDFNGMEFPCRVGINNKPHEKNGKTYWNNLIGMVITPDKAEYAEVKKAGEIITDGPVVGTGTPRQQAQSQGDGFGGDDGMPWSDPDDPGASEVPF